MPKSLLVNFINSNKDRTEFSTAQKDCIRVLKEKYQTD